MTSLSSALQPPVPHASPLTMQQALDRFLTYEAAARNFTASTRTTYTYDLRAFLAASPDCLTPGQLNLATVKQYLVALDQRGLSSATKHRKLAVIKSFMAFLEAEEPPLVPVPFAARIPLPRVERREPRYLSKEEYQALLREAASHPRDAAILEVLLQTGIRLQELVNLTHDDVELPVKPKRATEVWEGSMRVQRKRRKVQYLPLNARACQKLQAYLKVRPVAGSRALFLTKYRTPMTSRSVQKALKKYAQAAGIPWAHPHTLRTTFCTHHIANGSPITAIKEMVGHENLATTNVYAGLVKSTQRKAMQEHAL